MRGKELNGSLLVRKENCLPYLSYLRKQGPILDSFHCKQNGVRMQRLKHKQLKQLVESCMFHGVCVSCFCNSVHVLTPQHFLLQRNLNFCGLQISRSQQDLFPVTSQWKYTPVSLIASVQNPRYRKAFHFCVYVFLFCFKRPLHEHNLLAEHTRD